MKLFEKEWLQYFVVRLPGQRKPNGLIEVVGQALCGRVYGPVLLLMASMSQSRVCQPECGSDIELAELTMTVSLFRAVFTATAVTHQVSRDGKGGMYATSVLEK